MRAFDRLPERWRSVLWLDQVEHVRPSPPPPWCSAPPRRATASLVTRALGGFREQLVQLKVHPDLPPDCRQATLRLSAYVACALPSRDTVRVRRHLDRCEDCRQRLDELDDVDDPPPGRAAGASRRARGPGDGCLVRARARRLGSARPAPPWWLAGARMGRTQPGRCHGGGRQPRHHRGRAAQRARRWQPGAHRGGRRSGRRRRGLAGDSSVDDGGTDGSTDVVSLPPITSGADLTSSGATASSSAELGRGSCPGARASRGHPPRRTRHRHRRARPPARRPRRSPRPPPPPAAATAPRSAPSGSSSEPVDEVVQVVDDVVDEVCGGLGPVCDVLPTQPPLPQIPGL